MAKKKVPPSADETRATGKSSTPTNDPPAPNHPNTRSSADIPAKVDTVNIRPKPSTSRIMISDDEVDTLSDDSGDLLTLKNPSFIVEKISKPGVKPPVPRLRHPNVPTHFDRRLHRQKRVKPPSLRPMPPIPLGILRHTSHDEDAAVQDALDDVPIDQFDESDDTAAGQALLNQAKTPLHSHSHSHSPQNSHSSTLKTQRGYFHNIDDVGSFGDTLNNALGAASPPAHTPSRDLSHPPSPSPSFEDSSSDEDYMDALTDAISTAADEKKYEALVATRKGLLQKKREQHAEDSRAYREWRASQAGVRKGKGKESEANPPPRRRVITKQDKEFLKSRMDRHMQEWTEVAGELGIETEDILQYVSRVSQSRRNNKWCVWKRLYGAENPGHRLSSKDLSALYRKEKAEVASEGKKELEEWYAANKGRLEKLESGVVWTSMSLTTRTNMMAKEARDLSERARIASNKYQYEIFGIIMNREVRDGQATANARMFSSSKGTGKILEKHIWNNMELRKKLQLDLINVDTPSADDNNMPTLEMWDAYRDTLTTTSGTHTLAQNEVRTAVSAKMTHLLRTVLESQGSDVSIGRGFPWNSLANFIYLNRPSFIIRNWPSTVPFQWVGDMSARQAQLLLQSLVVGFIYKEEGSNQSVLMPNSRIRFEPFNPGDEDRASHDFGNRMVMSDETGRTLMRIKDSVKWRDLQVRNLVGHEKKTKKVKETSRTRGRAQTEVNIVRRKVSDDQGYSSDDHPRVKARVPKPKRANVSPRKAHNRSPSKDGESDDSEHNVRVQTHSKRAKAGTHKSRNHSPSEDNEDKKDSDNEDDDDVSVPPSRSKTASKIHSYAKISRKDYGRSPAVNDEEDEDEDETEEDEDEGQIFEAKARHGNAYRRTGNDEDGDASPPTRSKPSPPKKHVATSWKAVAAPKKVAPSKTAPTAKSAPSPKKATTKVVKKPLKIVGAVTSSQALVNQKRRSEASPEHSPLMQGHGSKRARGEEKVGPPQRSKKLPQAHDPREGEKVRVQGESKRSPQVPASPTMGKFVIISKATKKRSAQDKGAEGPTSKRQRK